MSSEVEMGSPSQRQAQSPNELHDEEESSLLLNGKSASPLDGHAACPSSPLRSTSLSGDFAVCNAAWSRLSYPTRSLVLLVTGVLLIFATYEFGMDEGVREQERDNAKHGDAVDRPWKSWRVFGGGDGGDGGGGDGGGGDSDIGDARSGNGGDVVHREKEVPSKESESEGHGGGTHKFSKEILLNTRAKAQELTSTLHEYYGGEEKAKAMLVKSWQAQWQLDEEFLYLGENEDQSDGDNDDDDDDDDDVGDDHDDDVEDDDNEGRRRRTKRNKGEKRNKQKNEDGDEAKDKRKERKKKNKGAKEGKIIEDPRNMSPEELMHHHHHRRQRTSKLVSTMARALLNPHQDRFIIGTIGSSVAAGHDNCHYDSYESQLERTLAPVFSAAGMSAIVQNAGEGGGCGDTHQNQVFCVTHNLSPNVDVIHYSWTYFEKERPEVQREQLVRWAQRMERRPMVHHMVARGKKNTCNGDVQANVDLDKHYAVYGYNAFCIQTGLYFGGHDYDADLEAGINRFGWKHQGDGYHNTTRYGEELPDGDARKNSLGTVYRNWHPGPLGFQIASDAFAYVYTTGLLMALDIIEEDMNAGADLLDRWFDMDRRRQLHSRTLRTNHSSPSKSSAHHRQLHQPLSALNMPEPLFCDPLYCSTPHPPNCVNYEKPTFGTPGIAVQNQAGWEVFSEDNKWNKMVGKVDIAIIKEMHDPEWMRKCAHLDACGGIRASDATQGTLAYELPTSKMTAGLVFLCFCCGKNVADDTFLQNPSVTVKLNDRVLDKSTMDLYPNKKCVRLLKQFGDDGYEKEDTMLLKLEMAEQDPNITLDSKPPVQVSHVVAL